jgi:hypothetical protein
MRGETSTVLLIGTSRELPAARRVWGTGGWMPAEKREALDWLMLCRLLGWTVDIIRPGDTDFATVVWRRPRCIILGCAPEMLSGDEADLLLRSLDESQGFLVSRLGLGANRIDAGTKGAFSQGSRLSWEGPGPAVTWELRHQMSLEGIMPGLGCRVCATLGEVPVIVSRAVGGGLIATIGFHPSVARDLSGFVTALLRHLLIYGPRQGVKWLDLVNTLILRMDDPGGAQNVYNHPWAYHKLDRSAWQTIASDLVTRGARLSIGYVSGWVDDGDAARGSLTIAGRPVAREPGRVYSSALVKYCEVINSCSSIVHDYTSEYAGIQDLRAAGAGDVVLHGYTHMHPDLTLWAHAADRYEQVHWYREFGPSAARVIAQLPPTDHPLRLGLAEIERSFCSRPTTLIFPGDSWTEAAVEAALDLGIDVISSYYLALRHDNRFCWVIHVCAPYLDAPDPSWFDSGLPVIGYFHDRDLAIAGLSWLRTHLDGWHSAGARQFIDFRRFSEYLASPQSSSLDVIRTRGDHGRPG